MAVNFHHHIESLIRDFQRRGLQPEIVQVSGNPPRSMEIRVAKKISVHWDADSRSVWAEGPWPEIERLESYIRRRFGGRWRRRDQISKRLVGVVAVSLAATVLLGLCIPAVRNQLPSFAWPFGEAKPKATTAKTTEHGSKPDVINKSEAKPIDTAAAE